MLMTLSLVQRNKAQRKVNQQIKRKSSANQDKIATVSLKLIQMILKKHLTTFQVAVLCKSSCKSAYCNSLKPW